MFNFEEFCKGAGGRRIRLLLALAAIVAAPALPAAAPSADRHAPAKDTVREDEGLAPRPKWENVPAVAATFLRESYRPGSTAVLVLWRNEGPLTLQLFHAGPEHARTVGNTVMQGKSVTPRIRIEPHDAHTPIRVSIGDWPSGLYFARIEAADGRLGFAPFVVRPRRLGEHRVLVVLPTYTWQAYNFRDDNRDGRGDTWYAGWKQNWAKLFRPFLSRGVPPHFRQYDLAFLHWLAWGNKPVDVFSDSDLGAARSARDLRRSYDLIVFPGHQEYVTTREYDLVTSYRDLGGHLMFLSADNFFWRIVRRGALMIRTAEWRDIGRPEAALIGVQYIGTDEGRHRGPWIVEHSAAASWLFADTTLADGDTFGNGGIEIDHTAASSPQGIKVLAEIPHLFGPRFTAQMTYYETRNGAKVFAAGSFDFAGSALDPPISRLLDKLWLHLET